MSNERWLQDLQLLLQVGLVVWMIATFLFIRHRNRRALQNHKNAVPVAMSREQSPCKSPKRKQANSPTFNNKYNKYLSTNIIESSNMMSCSSTYNIESQGALTELDYNSSSSSEEGKENRSLSPVSCTSPTNPHRTTPRRRRRQRSARENRILIENPIQSDEVDCAELKPLDRFIELNMTENAFANILARYRLNPDQLTTLGYPVESAFSPNCALIYAIDFASARKKIDLNNFDINAFEKEQQEDSGQGSGGSSPRSPDSDPESEEKSKQVIERRCARCASRFTLNGDGEYITKSSCRHHYGRLVRVPSPIVVPFCPAFKWSCCGNSQKSVGCDKAPLHVWSGAISGMRGPLPGYCRSSKRVPERQCKNVLALDCEMVYTSNGLEVAQLEVIGPDGLPVYSAYIIPENPIVDYNTRFSGITEEDMVKATKSLTDVQHDLMNLIDSDTILVGHALENDLRGLRVLHTNIVDTAVCFPHERGLPYRQSLRALSQQFLNNAIHQQEHCPMEDARVTMDLVMWRVLKDIYNNTLPELVKW